MSQTAPTGGPVKGSLRFHHYLGYGAGDAANNLAFSMASMFLLLYYTDVVGISAAAAGTIFLVIRIWDAVGDLIAGRLIDRGNSRWGKFRPWLLFASLPLLLLSVAVFTVPDLSPGWTLAYAYLSYGALAMVYSLVNIPYGSLAPAITQDSQERAKLATARTLGAASIMLLLSFAVSPQIENSDDLQGSLTSTTLVFVAVGFALYLWTFFTTRENVERDVARVGLRESLVALRGNKPLIVLCTSALSMLVALFSLQAINIYYARDVLGNANYFIVLTLLTVGATFVIAPLVPRIVAAVGKKRAYVLGATLGMAGGAGVMLAPASSPLLAFVAFGVLGLGLGAVNTLMWALEADTVEYGEWKSGVRTEGVNYAVFSFVRKLGQALGGAAAAYIIGWAGYSAQEAVQSEAVQWSIRAAAGLVPMIFLGIGIAIMSRYTLTESAFRSMVDDIRSR